MASQHFGRNMEIMDDLAIKIEYNSLAKYGTKLQFQDIYIKL